MKAYADHNDSSAPILTGDAAALDEIAAFPEQNPHPVFRVGATGSLLYANSASVPLLAAWGVTTAGELLPEPWRARAAAALAAGGPAKWDAQRDDHVLQLNFVPILPRGYVNVYGADVTELRHARDAAERRAQAQLAHHANLLAHLDDAVIATDLEQRVTAWNPAAERLFGWTEAEAVGRLIPDFLPTEFANAERPAVYRQVSEQGQWRGEMVIIARDGSRVCVETTGVLIRDADGRATGRVGVSRDISRRKAVEAQNARLLEELTAGREQLRALSQRFVAMQEAERSYVADQLYNQAGQVLAAAQMQLARLGREDAGEQLPLINATLNEAIGELHALASQLRPYALDRSTLASALRAYLAEFGRQHGLAVAFDAGNAASARPAADAATSLFRSLQEGLTNVARHAFASEIAVALRVDDGTLFVTLTDDGVGFEPQAAGLAGGLGLASIRERLKTVGGQLTVASGPDGSALVFSAPLGDRKQPQ